MGGRGRNFAAFLRIDHLRPCLPMGDPEMIAPGQFAELEFPGLDSCCAMCGEQEAEVRLRLEPSTSVTLEYLLTLVRRISAVAGPVRALQAAALLQRSLPVSQARTLMTRQCPRLQPRAHISDAHMTHTWAWAI